MGVIRLDGSQVYGDVGSQTQAELHAENDSLYISGRIQFVRTRTQMSREPRRGRLSKECEGEPMRTRLTVSAFLGLITALCVQLGCSGSKGAPAGSGGSGAGAAAGSGSGGVSGGPMTSGTASGGSGGASNGFGGATSGLGGAANGGTAATNSGGTGGFASSSGGQSGSGGTTVASSVASCDAGILSLQAVWPMPSTNGWPWAIAVDGLGNVYAAGSFEGSASFGNVVLTSNGPEDMFLAKFDSTGALVYANHYGGDSFDDESPALAVDDVGNAYLGGGFGQTLDFGGGTTPLVALTSDAFVAKIGPTGQTIWAQRFGWDGETWANGGGAYIYAIATAPGGDPVIAGTAGATITLGSTNWTSAGTNSQPFVARLKSADGSVVWGAASGGTFDTDQLRS